MTRSTAAAPALHLYTADISPFAQRVVIQLEAKGLPFTHELPPGGLASEAYALINPIRKMPTLRVGEGFNLPESEVICEYLEDLHPEPSLRPADPLVRARMRLITRIIDLYVMNPMMPLFKNLARQSRDEAVVAASLAAISNGLDWLEPWVAPERYAVDGRLTLADCAAAPVLLYVTRYPPIFGMKEPLASRPNLTAYLAAVRQDPHVDAALGRIEAGWDALRKGAAH